MNSFEQPTVKNDLSQTPCGREMISLSSNASPAGERKEIFMHVTWRRAILSLIAFCIVPAFAQEHVVQFSHPDRIKYDGHCITIEGKDLFIYSGAFHYFRCPKPLWRDRLTKIKEAGFNAVETYVA